MATAKKVPTSAPAPAKKKYLHTQAWYADAYGKSLPTIKRWWKSSYPLDDPDLMSEYLSPAGRKSEAEIAAEGDPEGDADSQLARERLERFGPEFMQGEGLLAEINRLRRAAKHAAEEFVQAVNPKVRENRMAEWVALLDVLRKIEKDNPEILRENNRTLPIEEVELGVTRLLFDIFGRLDMLPLRGMQSLVGLDAFDIREELEREIERVKQPIRECVWIPEADRASLPVPDSGTPREEVPAAAEKVSKSVTPRRNRKRKKT